MIPLDFLFKKGFYSITFSFTTIAVNENHLYKHMICIINGFGVESDE